MVAGIFHEGSGLGNQLFRYITTRVLAEGKGYEWGMIGNFKGTFFSEKPRIIEQSMLAPGTLFTEKKVVENGVDIRSYDPEINFVEDNTVIDGEFQDQRYWGHRLKDIDRWLKVETLEVPDDLCVIGFRGGEYYSDPNLGLPKEYFDLAIREIRNRNQFMRFEVHTDDTDLARQFFPDIPIVDNPKISHSLNENMGYNWRAMRYAKYAIISNSSFYIIPRLLQHETSFSLTIAPRYWARRNTGVWGLPQNYYPQFLYL